MRSQRGVTMIEVLVTLLVTVIGLLGLASMQLVNLKNVNNSQYRTQATILAYSMAERMRSNQTGVVNGYYNDISTATVDGSYVKPDCSSGCSAINVAKLDLYEWDQSIEEDAERGGLPANTVGTVTVDGVDPNLYYVAIIWNEQTRNSVGGTVEQKGLTLSIRI